MWKLQWDHESYFFLSSITHFSVNYFFDSRNLRAGPHHFCKAFKQNSIGLQVCENLMPDPNKPNKPLTCLLCFAWLLETHRHPQHMLQCHREATAPEAKLGISLQFKLSSKSKGVFSNVLLNTFSRFHCSALSCLLFFNFGWGKLR